MGDGTHPRSDGGLETVIRGLSTRCRDIFTRLKVLYLICYCPAVVPYIISTDWWLNWRIKDREISVSICVVVRPYAHAMELELASNRKTMMSVNNGATDRILR